jgi:YggT family protein
MPIIIYFVTKILILIVVTYAILSWAFPTHNPVYRFFSKMVDPMLFPIRKVVPYIGRVDISPIILIIIIHVAGNLLGSALSF